MALLFLFISAYFAKLLYEGHADKTILGRGFFRSKYYSRDEEPIFFWINFASYSIISTLTLVFGIFLLFK
jgi:hypothetical protein